MHDISLTKNRIIFISGRFRSGTSMLWNLFNQLPQYCAWYEPLHQNLLKHIEFVKPQTDHIGINDYWGNYRSIGELEKFHLPQFGQQQLFLEKHDKWPELAKYIKYLISQSDDKIPVLQFNRTDLRLSWLKNNFPSATIINIERQAYPLWVSSRKHIQTDINKNNESFHDAYDLMQWSVELSKHFPMLQVTKNRNSYYRHYFIWKLSKQMAQSNADIHLSLENDFLNTQNGVATLASQLDWDQQTISTVQKLIQKPQSMQVKLSKARLFTEIEDEINEIFQETGLEKLFPSTPLPLIKLEYHKAWSKYQTNCEASIQELLAALKNQNDALTAMAHS